MLAGLPTLLEMAVGLAPLAAMKASLVLFCALYLASAALYARLPARVGEAAPSRLRDLSPESRPIIAKISALFFVDAFAGGFIGSAIFAYWFSERFGATAATVAVLFSAGRLLSAASHIAAAWLAKRIGLINTMVYTHIPSSAAPLHDRRLGRVRVGRVLLPAARGAQRDGRAHAPVLRDGRGEARRAPGRGRA